MRKPSSPEEYIDFLKSLDHDYTYFYDSSRLDICIILPIGLYEGFSMYVSPVEGPEKIPAEEYAAITTAMNAGEDLDEFFEEHVAMVQSGCEPEQDYYRWSPDISDGFGDDWHMKDQMLGDLEDAIVSNAEVQPWDQMDEGSLEYWYEKLMEIQNGRTMQEN